MPDSRIAVILSPRALRGCADTLIPEPEATGVTLSSSKRNGLSRPTGASRARRPGLERLEVREVLSGAAYVTGLYEDLLRREPSPAEVAAGQAALDAGASRLDLARGVAGSA